MRQAAGDQREKQEAEKVSPIQTTLTLSGPPADVRGRQSVVEVAEAPPHPARDGW
jgi:hypothetical protein